MENRETKKRLLERLYKISGDFHNIHTPFSLCDEMLDKIEGINGDMNILVMFNLEFIWSLKEKIGSLDNIWFFSPCELKKKFAVSIGINENHLLSYSYNDNKVIEENMPQFDVVVGNPPYKGMMHLDFLEIAYKISNGWIVWVQPSNWLIDKKGIAKRFKELKNIVANNIEEIKLFNGNPYFKVNQMYPFNIITINKNKKESKFKLIDEINRKEIYYNNINEINKWSDPSIYNNLQDKILKLSNKDNINNYLNIERGNYYINMSKIRGNINTTDIHSLWKDDYYSTITKNAKIELSPSMNFWFSFETIEEAQNFLDFLKIKWSMFSLSIYKNSTSLHRGELKAIPWLDWSRSWTEKDFEELIEATEEEKEFVYKNIPNYYNI